MDCSVRNETEAEPIVINRITIRRILAGKSKRMADLIALYVFYYHCAKEQDNKRPRATTGWTAEQLGWTEERVRLAKQELIGMTLVEDVIRKNEKTQKVIGHYIFVRYQIKDMAKPHSGSDQRVDSGGDSTRDCTDKGPTELNTDSFDPNPSEPSCPSSTPPIAPTPPPQEPPGGPTVPPPPRDPSGRPIVAGEGRGPKYPKESWLTVYGEAWSLATRGGILPFSHIAKDFKTLEAKFGRDRLIEAWKKYLRSTDPAFLSGHAFVTKAGLFMGPEVRKAESVYVTEEDRMNFLKN